MSTETFITSAWHGDRQLWPVYWISGVLGSILLVAVLAAVVALVGLNPVTYLLAAAVLAIYTVWVLVAVWRCAFNVGHEHWAYIARALTVFWALNVLMLGIFLGLDTLVR